MTALLLLALVSAPDPVVDEALAIGKKLRCPVCQGMPVADSPSDMARAMQKKIENMVREGKTEAEIQQYFIARYGEWVLLEPKPKGFNLLLWLLPLLLVLGSVLLARGYVQRRAPTNAPVQVESSGEVSAIRQAVLEDE